MRIRVVIIRYAVEAIVCAKRVIVGVKLAMPLEKAHKRRRRAFLADLTRKKHCKEPFVSTAPVSLDTEVAAVSMETSVTEGEQLLLYSVLYMFHNHNTTNGKYENFHGVCF